MATAILFVSVAVLVVVSLTTFSPHRKLSTPSFHDTVDIAVRPAHDLGNDTSLFSVGQPCDVYPDPGNLVVSVKTGATEALDRLPTQLMTSLRCVQNPLIFSDLEQKIGRFQIHDVLAHFSPAAMEGNADFDIYRLQKALVAEGHEIDLSSLSDMPMPQDDWRTHGHSAAWGLDKYKFLHMIEHAWELSPGKDWYLFIEADTYLVWSNLLRWISLLDPNEKRFFGYPIRMWEHEDSELYFAYGGAGFLLSGAAVREFTVKNRGLANRWDNRISGMWFGDYVLAAALEQELGLTVTDAWPSMNPDESEIVPFGPGMWCDPVLTLHHMDALHSNELWQSQQRRGFEQLLFRDLYYATYLDGVPTRRSDWDNMSSEEKMEIAIESDSPPDPDSNNFTDPHSSEQACEDACSLHERCFQFTFVTTTAEAGPSEMKCHLSSVFRLGRQKSSEQQNDEGVSSLVSGWMRERIAKWIRDHEDCTTSTPSWPQ